MKKNQLNAPIYEALLKYRESRIVSFDVPGHKQGKGIAEITSFLGEKCLSIDVNSMKPLDNLIHPVSVIREAEMLSAEAFRAKYAFFIVGGTSAAVQAMILATCKRGDKIIMPRNVHRSAINALILCGAEPVYVNPGINKRLGISLGMSIESLRYAIEKNPTAKAVFVNNPTYYGVCSNLKEIVKLAHKYGMKVLVDEAHGTHYYFGEDLPVSAMDAGADYSAISMHKTGGSLTQSSFLLIGNDVSEGYTRQIVNLTQTTSASYILLSSLDLARRHLSINGKKVFKEVCALSEYGREEINNIGGYYAFSKEIIDGDAVFDFDVTKLSVHTRDIGRAGIEVYDILRDNYDIQIEFGDIGNVLAIVSLGDRPQAIERLVSALTEIKRLYEKEKTGMLTQEYINPIVSIPPQEAFYREKQSVSIKKSVGMICGEFVMCYPPGIPILAPGEMVTKEIIEYIDYAKEKGCRLTGTEDMKIENLKVVI